MSHSNGQSPESTSSSLLQRVQAQDVAAWERLAALYGPVVYGWALRAGLGTHDAADIVQDVFQTLVKKIAGFTVRPHSGSFRGWLWTICRNKIHDHFRRRKREAPAAGGTDAYDALQNLPESQLADESPPATELDSVRRRAMELVSGEFEGRVWQAFWRTTIESAAPRDVAEELGMSVWAVYKARARVLSRLREEFSGILD